MGLVGNRIKNVSITNIKVEYRGGLSLEHAVEQRQLNTNWEYTQYGKEKSRVQSLPWLVNTFFLKNEGLLPRVEWDSQAGVWKDAPFNVPELPEVYPEPSNWGILPAYGLYARHVDSLYLEGIELQYLTVDTRYPIVLDDIVNGSLHNIHAHHAEGVEEIVCVSNSFKRPAGLEYVPDYPYHQTAVEHVKMDSHLSVKTVEVGTPAPGTPKDSLYPHETVAIPRNGYKYPIETKDYPLPQTVFQPFFAFVPSQKVKAGESLSFTPSYVPSYFRFVCAEYLYFAAPNLLGRNNLCKFSNLTEPGIVCDTIYHGTKVYRSRNFRKCNFSGLHSYFLS